MNIFLVGPKNQDFSMRADDFQIIWLLFVEEIKYKVSACFYEITYYNR